MDVCVMPQQLNSDFDKVSDILIQHYDKKIETQLNSDEQQLLDEMADKLNEISNAQNINLNKDGFKRFVKKLYVYDFTQFGGGPPDELVPYSRKKSYMPNKYDFFAILLLISSIFILYISFVKFNELSQSVTGMSIDELGEDVKSQVQEVHSKMQTLPREEITFLQYVWSNIQTFSCSIIETQTQRFKNVVTESISNTVQDYTEIARRTCIPRTQVISEGSYFFSSYLTGDIDVGTTVNSLVQGASVVAAPTATSSCITNTALLLQKKAFEEFFHQKGLMLNQLTGQSTQAITFLTYGAQMGLASVMYLVYRTKDVLGIAYAQFRPTQRIQNSRSITEKGGNRKKNTKKNKKYRKKSKKYRKISRKYIKKSRK